MKSIGFLPYLQKPAIGRYPEPDEPSPHPQTLPSSVMHPGMQYTYLHIFVIPMRAASTASLQLK
jgi:hypothetical protein